MEINETHLEAGYSFQTASRTITQTDIVNFAGLSNDWDPLHIDHEFAKSGPFGRPIAHGQLTASIVTGLRSELDEWPLLNFLGTSREFSAPVGDGDTIHGVYSVVESRPTSKDPSKHVVILNIDVLDQHGNTVVTGQDVVLVDRGRMQND